MAKATNIKRIVNNTTFAISLSKDDSNSERPSGIHHKQLEGVGAGQVWSGNLWTPWVGGNNELWKCIDLRIGKNRYLIF